MEHIHGINWGLGGNELTPEQAIQRLAVAGWPLFRRKADGTTESPILIMWAIIEGESGGYQKAWHINVVRDPNGMIIRQIVDGKTYMTVKSIDLGFIQKNTTVEPFLLEMDINVVAAWVEHMFDTHPELADPWQAAEVALAFWKTNGFNWKRWFAYKPGTREFWLKKKRASKWLANWLVHSFVGRRDTETNEILDLLWKSEK